MCGHSRDDLRKQTGGGDEREFIVAFRYHLDAGRKASGIKTASLHGQGRPWTSRGYLTSISKKPLKAMQRYKYLCNGSIAIIGQSFDNRTKRSGCIPRNRVKAPIHMA